jgi:AcrR family transcriptional regulator
MTNSVKPRTGERGRPRSTAARAAILRAARELLERGGPGAVTMEAVASLAQVGKPTVYRWWPDRHAVAMAALMESEDERPRRKKAESCALDALRAQMKTIVERFKTPSGRHVAALIAAADSETELSKAFRNHFVLARRSEGVGLLQQAIKDGELRPELDVEIAVELLYGPLFFRLLTGHAPLNAAFVDRVLDLALSGFASPKPRAPRPTAGP